MLPDRTRVDCLTDTQAVEVERGPRWAEAIGQALYYALQTNRKAGIVLVLVLEGEVEYRYWIRLNTTIDTHRLPLEAERLAGMGLVAA